MARKSVTKVSTLKIRNLASSIAEINKTEKKNQIEC